MIAGRIGPDARRYLAAASGTPVPRPFHLRWLLPYCCGSSLRAWWWVWAISWPVAAAGMFAWIAPQHGWQIAAAATALLLSLPGILGPSVVIPVGVDLPATAVTLVSVALIATDNPWHITAGVLLLVLAATIRETAPVWAALWVWSPWPLLALIAPLIAHLVRKQGPDPLGERFQLIADHPVRSALEHHHGRWRDAWLLVAPWCVPGSIDRRRLAAGRGAHRCLSAAARGHRHRAADPPRSWPTDGVRSSARHPDPVVAVGLRGARRVVASTGKGVTCRSSPRLT